MAGRLTVFLADDPQRVNGSAPRPRRRFDLLVWLLMLLMGVAIGVLLVVL